MDNLPETRYNGSKEVLSMTIVKKSGKKEEFSADKLSKSIAAAFADDGAPLEDQELREIVLEFQQIVSGKNLITSQHVDIIVNGLLYAKGYFGVLEQYVSYGKNK